MSDENKIEKVEVKQECFCQSKWFRKFSTVAVGTFVGVFCALSLFSALNKPQMPPCPFGKMPMMHSAMHCNHFYNNHYKPRGEFYHKKFMKDRISPDRVKVEVKD